MTRINSTEQARASRNRFRQGGGVDLTLHLHGPLVKALDTLQQAGQSRQDVIVKLIEQAASFRKLMKQVPPWDKIAKMEE